MSATLVAIESAATKPPSQRAERLERDYREAEEALYRALYAAGLLRSPVVSPAADPSRLTPVERLLVRLWHARVDLFLFYEAREQKVSRTLRQVLACEALTDEHRDAILGSLYGRASSARNGKLLSEHEGRLIAQYRAMDITGKQMLRTLLERLAATSEKGGA